MALNKKLDVECACVNEDSLEKMKQRLREEADDLYHHLDKGDVEGALATYYQLSHEINCLNKFVPQLDANIIK